MTKTDDGFCCSFNTVSVQSTFAREETSTVDYESEEWVFCIFVVAVFTCLWNIRYASYYYDEYPLPPPALYDYGYGDDYGQEGSGGDEGGSGDEVDEGGEDQDSGEESGTDDGESSDDDNGSGSSSSSEELQPPQETWWISYELCWKQRTQKKLSEYNTQNISDW